MKAGVASSALSGFGATILALFLAIRPGDLLAVQELRQRLFCIAILAGVCGIGAGFVLFLSSLMNRHILAVICGASIWLIIAFVGIDVFLHIFATAAAWP